MSKISRTEIASIVPRWLTPMYYQQQLYSALNMRIMFTILVVMINGSPSYAATKGNSFTFKPDIEYLINYNGNTGPSTAIAICNPRIVKIGSKDYLKIFYASGEKEALYNLDNLTSIGEGSIGTNACSNN